MHFPVELPPDILALARKLGVRMEDIQEYFTRGSGHGGQKVNKSTNCVELTHRPTGMRVRVHEHRSQHRNRVTAFTLLIQHIAETARTEERQAAAERFRAQLPRLQRSPRAQENILHGKRLRSGRKRARKNVLPDSEELQSGGCQMV